MANFYFKYTPSRLGISGVEYLSGWLDQYYPTVSFNPVISDGMAQFGILSGSGDDFSKAMAAIEGKFSSARISEEVFIGVCAKYYNPVADMEGETPPTLDEFLTNIGITPPIDKLPNIKASKKELLKEVAKKKFANLNDTIADIAKTITLLQLHAGDLTTAEQIQVDNISNSLKAVYDKATCISAYDRMVSELNTMLVPYYTAVTSVETAVDADEVNAVIYE